MSVKFRFQRGGLQESMQTCIEVNTKEELYEKIKAELSLDGLIPVAPIEKLSISKYGKGIDERIGWDTHLVLLNGQPVGFTDGAFIEKKRDQSEWDGYGYCPTCGHARV